MMTFSDSKSLSDYQIMYSTAKLYCVLVLVLLCVGINGRFRRRKKIIISQELPSEDILNLPKVNHQGWVDPCFYFTMDSVLEVWKKAQVQFPGTRMMRSLFINKCFTSPTVWDDKDADRNRKPFINIESNSPKTRDAVAKVVAQALKGQYLENPPKCLSPAWYIYGNLQHELHRPYMGLGLYGLSHAVKVHWVRKPVVMTGYWYDLTCTTLADLFADTPLPPESSAVYTFPRDMIKPDLTVFLDMGDIAVEELENTERDDERPSGWVERYTNIFLTFLNNDSIHQLEWKGEGAERVTESITELIQDQLGARFQISLQK